MLLLRPFFILLGLLAAVASAADDRPNIVFIFADDLGINDLSCYGRKDQPTPHLDKLASEGVRFTRSYCAMPICSPSRLAVLTGQSPARLHLTTFLPGRANAPSQKLLHPVINQRLALDEQTIAERLKAAGYVTACVGKWHLGGAGFGPKEQGFDFVHVGQANTRPSESEGGKGEFDLTAKAIEFIETNRDKPFFLYLPHNNPHIPLAAQAEKIEKHRAAGAWNPVYAAVVETLDESVGRLLAKLDELKLRENTLVVFTSDNGGLHIPEGNDTPATHNTPFRAGKGFLYEGGLRVPAIARWPGKVLPGRVEETPISGHDWTPTFLAAAGAQTSDAFEGISNLPLLTRKPGEAEPTRPPRLFCYHFPHYTNQGSRPAGAIFMDPFKLIEHYEDGRLELFDLAADPSETTDLAAKEPDRVAQLRGHLERWRRANGVQENKANPAFQPAMAAACYTTVDVSKLAPEKTMEATRAKYLEWRQAMNHAIAGQGGGKKKPADPPSTDSPAGFVLIRARDAKVAGEKLRYEPEPHKDTLGFWVNPADTASWTLTVPAAGKYAVEVLQGCGKGNGGSEVAIQVGGKSVAFTVTETGHFQHFIPRQIGVLELAAGEQTLVVKPLKKPGGAVMDLRQVTLTRQ